MSLTAVATRIPPTRSEEETLLLLTHPSFLPADGILLTPGRWSFGSDPSNDVVLTQTGVQARHLQILVGRRRIIVKAWDRRTWLNDSPIQEAPLRPGDQITLGPVTLRCEQADVDDLLRQVPSTTTNDAPQDSLVDTSQTEASPSFTATAPPPDEAPAVAEILLQSVGPTEIPAEETPIPASKPAAAPQQLANAIRELEDREDALRKLACELAATEAKLNRERDLFWEESLAWEASVARTRDELDRSSSDLEQRARRLEDSEAEAARRAEEFARKFALLESRDKELRAVDEQASRLTLQRQQMAQRESELVSRADDLRSQQEGLERARLDLDDRMRVFESRQSELERRWSEDEQRLKSARVAVDELIDALEAELIQQQSESERLAESRQEQSQIESDRAEQDRLLAMREDKLIEQARRIEGEQHRLREISHETEQTTKRTREAQELLEAERLQIRQEADQLADERADWEKARRQWTAETEQHARAQHSLDAQFAELSTLRDSLDRRESTLAARESWTSSREAELTRAAEELDQEQIERQQLAAEIAERQDDLGNREAELERRREHLEDELARRIERQSELEQQLSERLARQGEEQTLSQAQLIEERDRLADQQTEIGELRAKLDRSEQKLLAREKAAEQELGRLREQLEAELAARQVLEARIEEIVAERASLEARLADLSALERQHNDSERSASEVEASRRAAEIASLEARQDELTRRQTELEASRQAIEERDESLAQRTQALEGEQRRLAEERAEFDRANTELSERTSRLENLASELTAREQALAEQIAELDTARAGLEASRLEIEALTRTVELDRLMTDAENQQREQELQQRETELSYQQQEFDETARDLAGNQALLEWQKELAIADLPSPPAEPAHAQVEPWSWTAEAIPSLPGQRTLFEEEIEVEASHLPFDVESLLTSRSPVADEEPSSSTRDEADEHDSTESVGSLRAELAKMFDLPGSPFGKQPESKIHESTPESLGTDDVLQDEPPVLRDESFASVTNPQTAISIEPPVPLQSKPAPYDAPEEDATSGEDDQSVSAYMNRLLNRLNRGDSVPSEPAERKPAPAPAPIAQIPDAIDESPAQPPVLAEPPTPAPTPRKPVDRTSDRLQVSSFREVANLSARTAVARHQWQQLRSVVTMKALLSAACLLTGSILSFGPLIGGQRMWLQGAACLTLGIFSGYDLYRTLVKSRVLIPKHLVSGTSTDRFAELASSQPSEKTDGDQQPADDASND